MRIKLIIITKTNIVILLSMNSLIRLRCSYVYYYLLYMKFLFIWSPACERHSLNWGTPNTDQGLRYESSISTFLLALDFLHNWFYIMIQKSLQYLTIIYFLLLIWFAQSKFNYIRWDIWPYYLACEMNKNTLVYSYISKLHLKHRLW